MYNFITDHAIKNVWCTPDQDMQSIVKLARLTPKEGVWTKFTVLWQNYALPEKGVRFHVYQIGQLHPLLMGLFPKRNVWTTFAKSCNEEKMLVDLYTGLGVEFPRTESWFMTTRDKNLIVAVKVQDRIGVDLGYNDLFLRVYSNAYFNSLRSDPLDDFIRVGGGRMLTTKQITTLQNEFEKYKKLPGQTYAFVNGYKVSALNLLTVKIDDVAEYVYDSSIFKVVDFPIDSLRTFESSLDPHTKYLLHQAGTGEDNIEYQDDLDVFLLTRKDDGSHTGVYYHRNAVDALRMVTHKDYSVPVANLLSFVANGQTVDDLRGKVLRLHIRHSGYERPLVNENNRIKELYKLNDLDLRKAMLGLDSVVENWRAETLEASAYTKVMRVNGEDITPALVEQAYGYNAIAKLLGDTPQTTRLSSGLQLVDVPYGLQTKSTVYEYDAQGKLLGYHNHTIGSVYACSSNLARTVEILSGTSGEDTDDYYGDVPVVIDPTLNYRFYVTPVVNAVAGKVWTDVTGGLEYSIVNGAVHWLVDRTKFQTLVRTDGRILTYDLLLNPQDGIYRFSLTHYQTRLGVRGKRVLEVLLGELDLWLNGNALVYGVDYFIRGVEIVIINQKFLVNPFVDNQKITVRLSGFCQADGSLQKQLDSGFVEYGMLSHNRRYDIRDDKILRIVAGGRVWDRKDLKFSEDDSGVYTPTIPNGVPYQIRDIVVPLRGMTPTDTYTLRAASIVIDNAISDYMTIKLPEPAKDGPNIIPERWVVYSPFVQKLISDLNLGILDDPRIFEQFNDADVLDICKGYEYLLKYDPTQLETKVDDRYVSIHPHCLNITVDMGIYQNRFLARAVKIYCNGLINLAPFIRVEKF